MLYRGALGAVRDARRFLAEGHIAERSRSISKAYEIVVELHAALDRQGGGEISSRLAALYDYLLRRLLEANTKQSDAVLADVFGLLSTLSEAWEHTRLEPEPAPVAENHWAMAQEAVPASQGWSL